MVFAGIDRADHPAGLALATPPAISRRQAPAGPQCSAGAWRPQILCAAIMGFFTCGFQLAFITVHFQRYVVEAGVSPELGYWAFALVGAFNIFGSLLSGWLGMWVPRRFILSAIYFSRAAATALFIALPAKPDVGPGVRGGHRPALALHRAADLVPDRNDVRRGSLSMLYGFAFFLHQVGGFLGVLLGGYCREGDGSYMPVWLLSIALGLVSGLLNLPIVEGPVEPDPQPAEQTS